MRRKLLAPNGFSFAHTVRSHGWWSLPPFEWDERRQVLKSALTLRDGRTLAVVLRGGGAREPRIESPGRLPPDDVAALVAAARRMLNLDLDLREFHRLALDDEATAWIARSGAGRLLRAPSPFEDLAKLILTTNCTWAGTTLMVRALVERWGEAAANGRRAFPTARALARAGATGLREAGLGYRAPLLAETARRVAAVEVDLAALERDERPTDEVKRALLELPGVGPYVAENMLRLAGRPDGLALDSWLRTKYARVHHAGRPVGDRTIARRYARFGTWAGLVVWCDMTRDWFDGAAATAAADALR